MVITEKHITVADLTKGYKDDSDGGVGVPEGEFEIQKYGVYKRALIRRKKVLNYGLYK